MNGEAPAMRALTVKNPWAWAIIHHGKNIENRSQRTKHRGRLYIHAGLGWANAGDAALHELGDPALPLGYDYDAAFAVRGLVIGTVDVIDCHHADDCWTGWEDKDGEDREELCSDWAMADHWHWELANPRPLATPFPERGKLGLWKLG